MNWWGIIVTFVFLPALAAAAMVMVHLSERDRTPRVGHIPDSVTPWRERPGYSIIEGEPAPFYDWEQGHFD